MFSDPENLVDRFIMLNAHFILIQIKLFIQIVLHDTIETNSHNPTLKLSTINHTPQFTIPQDRKTKQPTTKSPNQNQTTSHLHTRQLRQASCPRPMFVPADKITDHCTKWAIVTPRRTACGTKHHFFNSEPIVGAPFCLFAAAIRAIAMPVLSVSFSRVGDIRPDKAGRKL